MKEIARQIAAASLFGLASLEESEEMGRRVEDWLSDSFKLMPRVFGYDLPGTAFRKMLRKADHLERVALELVERKSFVIVLIVLVKNKLVHISIIFLEIPCTFTVFTSNRVQA